MHQHADDDVGVRGCTVRSADGILQAVNTLLAASAVHLCCARTLQDTHEMSATAVLHTEL
jgi:hypothetical protein